ncbi:MAG TPA: PEGA domain-containing protein, partial [Aggregicoccus sp.]|nr:PEGA domain-containing protein [Aggregicoccus sp.]
MRCLAKKPDQRFQSMEEVLEAMKRASTSAGTSGAFNTSPQLIGSGPLQVGSGALPLSSTAASRLSQTGAQRLHQAAAQSTGAHTEALDISMEEDPPRRKLLPMALFGGAALLGLGAAAFFLLRSPTPAPPAAEPMAAAAPAAQPQPAAAAPVAAAPVQAPAPEAPAPEAPGQAEGSSEPKVVPVRFLVASDPAGARVIYRGRNLGETPVQLEVAPGARGRAEAELTFVLSGYERVVATAGGRGPEVRFTQRLKKKQEARPKPGSPGYKEDPYQ